MESVIDEQHYRPYSVTVEKWKERKEVMESLNDRGWAHQGMSAYAGKTRRSVLNRHWQRHVSDKTGIWYDMPPCVKKALWQVLARSGFRSNLHPRVDLDGQGGRME